MARELTAQEKKAKQEADDVQRLDRIDALRQMTANLCAGLTEDGNVVS